MRRKHTSTVSRHVRDAATLEARSSKDFEGLKPVISVSARRKSFVRAPADLTQNH